MNFTFSADTPPALEAGKKNVKKIGEMLLVTVNGDIHNMGENIWATIL
jgi:methanogenic corrinoid protein MtbC1